MSKKSNKNFNIRDSKKKIDIADFCKRCDLIQMTAKDQDYFYIKNAECVRPSFELAGYFDYFEKERIQVFGTANCAFIDSLEPDTRKIRLKQILDNDIPAVVAASNNILPKYVLNYANKRKIPVFYSNKKTSETINIITNYLIEELATVVSKHGVLVEVYGIGVLITGGSGIGKSECALELIKRGHRLVVDDVVTIRKISSKTLIGYPDDLIKHYMEIRGIGIIDIKELFGISAIAEKKKIELIINFEKLSDNKYVDRLGLDENYDTILDVKIPKITIPVNYGKNLAIIVEVATMNYHLKESGINPAQKFMDRLAKKIESEKDINRLLN